MTYVPKGYTYNPEKFPTRPYRAQMSVNRYTVSLGDFATAEEATAAYQKARAERPRMLNYKPKENARKTEK